MTLRELTLGLVLVGGAVSCLLMATTAVTTQIRAAIGGGYALLAATIILSSPTLYDGLYEKLLYQDDYYPGRRFAPHRRESKRRGQHE